MMKKWLSVYLVVVLITFLTACGSEELAGDTNSSEDTEEQAASKQSETEEVQEEPKLEIVQSTGAAWKDSIDTVWVHSSAIFENTGDVPITIGETQMNFKDQEGGILGTSPMIYSVPSVVGPGEQAYISETTILEGITDPALYGETSYNYSFDPTEESPNLLEVSGTKGIASTDDYSTPYTVTGLVKNTTKELQDDIRISAALFDESGTLLGVLNGSVDVGVNPGSEAGFELNYPEVPREIAGKVKTIDVKAYGWTW
jgi:hypothetical protein